MCKLFPSACRGHLLGRHSWCLRIPSSVSLVHVRFIVLCKRAVFVSNCLSSSPFFFRMSSFCRGQLLGKQLLLSWLPLSVSHVHGDFICFVNVQFLFPTCCPGLPVSVQDEMFGNKILEAARVRLHALYAWEYRCTDVLWPCVAAFMRAMCSCCLCSSLGRVVLSVLRLSPCCPSQTKSKCPLCR